MLIRKHTLSELQPLIATIAALYHMGEKLTITTNAGWFSPETTNFSALWKSADSAHEFTRTTWDVKQISAATEAWRAILHLLRYEPRGRLTWRGCLNPALTFSGLHAKSNWTWNKIYSCSSKCLGDFLADHETKHSYAYL